MHAHVINNNIPYNMVEVDLISNFLTPSKFPSKAQPIINAGISALILQGSVNPCALIIHYYNPLMRVIKHK